MTGPQGAGAPALLESTSALSATAVPPWLPLGVPLGFHHGNSDGGVGVIRLGTEMIKLEPTLYDAWVALASNDTVADRGAAPSRAQLTLEEEGLLMRLPADPDRALRRLHPMFLTASGIGAGNSPTYQGSFVIVSQERRPLVLVDGPTYAVWSRAGAGNSFGSACRAAGEDLGDVALVSRAFLMSLPILIMCAVVFIEPPSGRIG